MRQRAIIVAVIAAVLTVAAPVSFAGLSQLHSDGKVTVRITVASSTARTGRFTVTGAITDKGPIAVHLSNDVGVIIHRFVAAGNKGTITFVVNTNPFLKTSKWTITTGTKTYEGLHGKGTERENAAHTISTLTGALSR